ncbi:hypothetical protein SAMN03159343_0892 [Klenkia marina]|uniref:Uncharacterized protein n=1 Tax=Klenkia marina TaxID=1960309 RepID=A0A1G4XFZ4_9ACTN|nr:hypothetical protein SAMN03159343_0892 [Klenkia marina]
MRLYPFGSDDVQDPAERNHPFERVALREAQGLVEVMGPLADGPGLRGRELHLHPLACRGVRHHDQQSVVPVADGPGVAPVVVGLAGTRVLRSSPSECPEGPQRLQHGFAVAVGVDLQREPHEVVHRPDRRGEGRTTLDRRLDLPGCRLQALDRVDQSHGLGRGQPLLLQPGEDIHHLVLHQVSPHLAVRHRLHQVPPQRLRHAVVQLLLRRGRRDGRVSCTVFGSGRRPGLRDTGVGPRTGRYAGGLTRTEPGLTIEASSGCRNSPTCTPAGV